MRVARARASQIRPQAQFQDNIADRFDFLPRADYAAVASKRALGHGRIPDITDVVYVAPERFDAGQTAAIAKEIASVNAQMHAAGRK